MRRGRFGPITAAAIIGLSVGLGASPHVRATPTYASGWTKVNVNDFADVAYTHAEHDSLIASTSSPSFWGNTGPTDVIDAWGGAAFDPTIGKMYFWGAGHSGYGGNEVYCLDFKTGTFSRVIDPFPYTGPDISEESPDTYTYPAPADGPIPTHSYDALEWNPSDDSFWVPIKGIQYDIPANSGQYGIQQGIWRFYPLTQTWNMIPGSRSQLRGTGDGSCASARIPGLSETWVVSYESGGKVTFLGDDGTITTGTISGAGVDNRLNFASMCASDTEANTAYLVNYYYQNAILKLTKSGSNLVSELISTVPPDVADKMTGGPGVACRAGVLWIWGQKGAVATYSPSTDTWTLYNSTQFLTDTTVNTVHGKWHYWPEFDVFVCVHSTSKGGYIFNPNGLTGVVIDPSAPRATVASTGATTYNTIQAANDASSASDTVQILAGEYAEGVTFTSTGLTIDGTNVVIDGANEASKGAFIIQGDGSTLQNIEIANTNVPDGNGACARMSGNDLTIKNFIFRDSQDGVLCDKLVTGTLLLQDGQIIRCGGAAGIATGRAHGVYANINLDLLHVLRTDFSGTKDEGHDVKSRAKATTVEDSDVGSSTGDSSRVIDVPNGGVLRIDGTCTIKKGTESVNNTLIGFANESNALTYGTSDDNGPFHQTESITIAAGTVFIFDKPTGTPILIDVGTSADHDGYLPHPVISFGGGTITLIVRGVSTDYTVASAAVAGLITGVENTNWSNGDI